MTFYYLWLAVDSGEAVYTTPKRLALGRWQKAKTTMKPLVYILTFLILTCCGQTVREQKNAELIDTVKADFEVKILEIKDTTIMFELDNYSLSDEFDTEIMFELTDTIKADFNGDGIIDQAVFRIENETSGIIITYGQTEEKIEIGLGKSFAHLADFNWVDSWGLFKGEETFEIVIEDTEIIGDRKVELSNPALIVRREESGGGLITFREGKYIWIHQAD
jgi:hypothetical protein